MRVLIICTGNSCRSQMAEGWLKSMFPTWEVFSAGTHPQKHVNPLAIKVMQERGIDISNYRPKLIDEFIYQSFDYVLTVCDSARETCPIFIGLVKHRLHHDFYDPARAQGTEEQRLRVFAKIKDEIRTWLESIFVKYF